LEVWDRCQHGFRAFGSALSTSDAKKGGAPSFMNGDVAASQGPALPAGSAWYQWYHVKKGDKLSEIGRWWYGRPQEKWWRRIWLANRRTIGENPDQQIERGEWLKLPYVGFSYHVEEKDTLPQLADWVYGDANMWQQIQYFNDWIKGRDDIQAGSWIWIP